MRKILLMSAAALALSFGTAAAQTTETPAAPDAGGGMTGVRPMRGQARHAVGHAKPKKMARAAAPAAVAEGSDGPRDGEYRGGAGSPLSTTAANTTAGNTRSEIAPRLPDPNAAGSTPEAYLVAARRALAAGKTGMAQEALERAETRVLSRSTDPAMADRPAGIPMVQSIGEARRALATKNTAGAQSAITAALGDSGGDAPATPARWRGIR